MQALRVKHDAHGTVIMEGNKAIARTYCRDGNATYNEQYKDAKTIADYLVSCANSQHGEISDSAMLNWILGRIFVSRESPTGDTWKMLDFDSAHWDCSKNGSHDMRKVIASAMMDG